MSATPLAESRLELPFLHLDTLWLQVTGTVCNIACRHCFISCGPKVRTHDLMSVERCEQALATAAVRGLREVWFTGGEPFLHPDILEIVDRAMARAPLGILTNGMLIDDELAVALGERFARGPYNLEIRVSLDGATRQSNDRFRGKGVFERATAGIRRLAREGLQPIVAVTQLDDADIDRDEFVTLMRELGVDKPRIKWIPPFRIGREALRNRAYQQWESLTSADLADEEAPWNLQCGTSRTVTSEGVFPCPILINEQDRRLGGTLEETLDDHPVDHEACFTCWMEGFSCST